MGRTSRAFAWAALVFGALLAFVACGGAPGVGDVQDGIRREADRLGPRRAVARALSRAEAAAARGDRRTEALELTAILTLSESLTDDRAVREAVLLADEAASPASLKAARALERARAALTEGRFDEVRRLTTGLVSQPGWLGARAQLLAALATSDVDPAASRALLEDVVRRPKDSLPGPVGRELKNFARLSLASQHYDAGRHGEALRGFLEVEESSGHWPAARFGLAWAQMKLKRPERTLAILALMPGGVAAEPERALLAAMATHHLGDPAVARDIVDAALGQLDRWDPALASPEAVLARLAAGAPRGAPFTMVEAVAARSAVLTLGGELLATRAELAAGGADELEAYEATVAALFADVVRGEASALAERAALAAEDLKTLRPQLEMR